MLIVVVILGLVVSGLTAFPLLHELNFLSRLLVGVDGDLSPVAHDGLTSWVLKVREGLEVTYGNYPFIAYGTDWLAFGHLMIALFFIPVLADPVRYRANMVVGVAASLLIIPLAFICGHIREIPIAWRLIDCSFGLLCLIPLVIAIRLSRRLEYDR